ncbi:hypothetical protein QUF75_17770 [Desulfococcaceae bacterium HSG7]|nr:hypothetical protein [Desulfococcaceae bacterium HSG9]MDM8556577.1 hypothetical protein [Desulfococcaceae bacterium HSG7]
MKTDNVRKERLKFFIIGVLTLLLLVFLTGAKNFGSLNGRYQISSWGMHLGENAAGCGAFIVDTATGNTKVAYTVIYGANPQRSVLINNLRKPFNAIK